MKKLEEILHSIQKEFELMRPPEDVRNDIDFKFTFENNILLLAEVSPRWDDKTIFNELPFAKARYYKSRNIWQLYWMRGNLKWEIYAPKTEMKTVKTLFETIREDKYNCFFG